MNNLDIHANLEEYKRVGQNRYILYVKVLGRGCFGETYQAKNVQTGLQLACKVIDGKAIYEKLKEIQDVNAKTQAKNRITQRLQNEVQNQISMEHLNIVGAVDFVQSKSQNYYIFMQLCEGGTLEKTIKERSFLPEQAAIKIFRQLTAGCVYLYEKSVIHRDLKPSNILLDKDVYKISDFGFSKALCDEIKDSLIDQTPWIGTPLYMSPQVIGQLPYSIKTDVWSLGCIFYEVLYGTTPWYSDYGEILQEMIMKGNVYFPDEPIVSIQMKQLIGGMLVKDETSRLSILQVQEILG